MMAKMTEMVECHYTKRFSGKGPAVRTCLRCQGSGSYPAALSGINTYWCLQCHVPLAWKDRVRRTSSVSHGEHASWCSQECLEAYEAVKALKVEGSHE